MLTDDHSKATINHLCRSCLLIFFLSACSGSFKQKLDFDPSEPLRIAVLPFHQLDQQGNITDYDPNIFFIDNLPGVSEEIEEAPAQVVEKQVNRELAKTNLAIVPRRFVQAQLVHGNFLIGTKFNHEKLRATPIPELARLFDADALLFGSLTEWQRSYYGVETVSSVGISLKLVRVADQKVIYQVTAEDSDSRGISKGPTGYSSVLLEPLKGLDNQIIIDLAQQVAQKSIAPLLLENRPGFLEATPPAIFAAAHDATAENLNPSTAVTVFIFGTGGERASFSIGNAIENIPMIERDPGHYFGVYYPLVSDSFSEQTLSVSLTDKLGRSTIIDLGPNPLTLNN